MRVRIKKSPNVGDQNKDYSLYTGKGREYGGGTPVGPEVNRTAKPVSREEANIEAEKGETIFGDLGTGSVGHFNIEGKKHSEGGTPLYVEPGSFVYSDARKLAIKDPEILKYFGKTARRKGYTPAEIAKQYDINSYKAKMMHDESDKLDTETSARMLENNTKKLAELAFIQESMKGLPAGVPEVAQMMKYGGNVKKYALAGEVDPDDPNLKKTSKNIQPYPGIFNSTGRVNNVIGMPAWQQMGARALNDLTYNIPWAITNLFNPSAYSEQNEVIPTKYNDRVQMIDPNQGYKSESQSPIKTNAAAQSRTNTNTNTNPALPSYLNKTGFEEYFRYDPSIKRFRVELPKDASTKLALEVAGLIDEKDNFKNFMQSGSVRTGNPYGSFYSNLTPRNFEDAHFIGKYGEERFATATEAEIRKEFLKDMGVEVSEDLINNPKALYNNKDLSKRIYKGFTTYYPSEKFREDLGNDQKFGLEHLAMMRAGAKKTIPGVYNNTPEKEVKEDVIAPVQELTDTTKRKNNKAWWTPDVINFAASMVDGVNRYEPTLYQVPVLQQDATFLDPTRMIAANQESVNKFVDAASMSAEGQVARANMLAAAGQSAEQIANNIANVENANVQIANQNTGVNTQLMQQGTVANTQLRKAYQDELATMEQNYDNSRRALLQRRINALNNGINNSMRTNWANTMFREYDVDPRDGSINFTGETDNTGVMGSLGQDTDPEKYAQEVYQRQLLQTGNESFASQMAMEAVKTKYGKYNEENRTFRRPTIGNNMNPLTMWLLTNSQQAGQPIPPALLPLLQNLE